MTCPTVLFGWPGYIGTRLTIKEAEAKTRDLPWLRGEARELFWRVEVRSYSIVIDYETEHYGSSDPQLELWAYPVIRRTQHGATIDHQHYAGGRKKWVDLREGAKQWASETPAEALAQYVERKRRQIYVLTRELARAERERALALDPTPLLLPA